MKLNPRSIKMAVRVLQMVAIILVAVTLIIQIEAVFTVSFDEPDWHIEFFERAARLALAVVAFWFVVKILIAELCNPD